MKHLMLLLRNALGPLILALGLTPAASFANVVINEILYHAPEDQDDVQWIELLNDADQTADLGGWTLDDGKLFTFPAETQIKPHAFLVAALNPERFTQTYNNRAVGPFKRPLKRGGEKLTLKDAQAKVVDTARFQDKAPWPVSADGYSASLERICPTASGESADNWVGSPLPPTPKPAGTPGAKNASSSAVLPPVVSVTELPDLVAPGQPLQVSARVKGSEPAKEVVLLYRAVTDKAEGTEVALPMAKQADGQFAASLPAQANGTLLRYRVKVTTLSGARRLCPAQTDLRPTFSTYVHERWATAPISLGVLILGGSDRAAATPQQRGWFGFGRPPGFGGRGGEESSRAPCGASAFIHVDSKNGKAELFDYVSAAPRNGERGFILHFHKDRPYHGMTAATVLFEGNERSLLVEALSYDLYRRAGNAAPLAEFVRLWVDGRMVGYQLLVERPNKSFLRRHNVETKGNLYKLRWFGQGIVGQHKKLTHTQTGHEDLVAVIALLTNTKNNPDEQWAVIQKHFDVDQVATHFAVNMVLAHWDGFFNNYYTYHDTQTDKWQMYAWDHDKTWGITDEGGKPLVDLPLTFGMEGAEPPGASGRSRGEGGFFGGGGLGWWRPPGYFSGPLLANPHFRKVFLSRVRKLLDDTCTEQAYYPVIDAMAASLGEDVALRAKARGESAESGKRRLAQNVSLAKTFLRQRREFLLAQPELRKE